MGTDFREVNIGDRVEVEFYGIHEIGTVSVMVPDLVGVVFDTYDVKRHSLEDRCLYGHGWWYSYFTPCKIIGTANDEKKQFEKLFV